MPRFLTLSVALVILVLAVACGEDSTVPKDVEADLVLQVASTDLAVGQNRFVVALFDSEANLILNAEVDLRLLKLEGEEEVAKAELSARYVGLQSNFVHEHDDSTGHTHTSGEVGLYVANVELDSAGIWIAEARATIVGLEHAPIRAAFEVREVSRAPNIGDPAPRSEQLTLRDAEIAEIDTANPPRPELHELTVAEALDAGQPIVIAFSTPAFCVSRICGPVLDEVVVPLFERYGDQVMFIHIEPYLLEEARSGGGLVPVATLLEWGLVSEPWVFVVDREGRIAGRFEGVASAEEVEAVLQEVLG